MTRNVLIASGALIVAVLLLYLLVFRPQTTDTPVSQLIDAAETLCLSNTTSSSTATLQSRLEAVKGVNATASAGTTKEATRGALASLSQTLQAEQDDKIRACMQPFVDKMIATTH